MTNPNPLPFDPQVQVVQTPQASSLVSFLVRLPVAFILSGVVVVLSGLIWGAIAYFTESIYVMIAILIGIGVTFALTFPFKRVPFLLGLILLLPAMGLTIMAVLWGDFIFYTLVTMNEFNMEVLDAAARVARYFIGIAITDEGESLASIAFAVIGAILGFVNAIRR
ncbi:MAG: hypothetical protein KA314_05175 [Chloroflexi bacterium]|nr:hypothetical protein [Chloroflexota bacterium]MBP8055209.1 hypothetical protein [Chloroflexota bacterium]